MRGSTTINYFRAKWVIFRVSLGLNDMGSNPAIDRSGKEPALDC